MAQSAWANSDEMIKIVFFFFLLFKFHVDCLICSATNGPPDLGKANLRFRGEIASCHLPGDRPVIMIMPLVMMVMMMVMMMVT